MSRAVQVRNVPDDVHEALKRRASARGQTLSEFLLGEMTRLAKRPSISDILEHAASTPGGASLDDAIMAIREDRERS